MKVAKWGNSLAVRLPAPVVETLNLKANDEIEIRVLDERVLALSRKPTFEELSERVRQMRGLMPKDYRFDRDVANDR